MGPGLLQPLLATYSVLTLLATYLTGLVQPFSAMVRFHTRHQQEFVHRATCCAQ